MKMAWICRYTSLTPRDVAELLPWQFDAFCDRLNEILEKESGGQE